MFERGAEPLAVFISVAEAEKNRLGIPFRNTLAKVNLRGYIVSDEPLLDSAWTPEEKVNVYLKRSAAVVVFATADLAVGADRFTRPNIADEIARARSMSHLRDHVCVLKESGVVLPSNINPAYEHLEKADVEEAFRRAISQLTAWGLVHPPSVEGRVTPQGPGLDHYRPVSSADTANMLEKALARVPDIRHTIGIPTLALTVVGGPRQAVMRPAELERSETGRALENLLRSSDRPIFDSNEPVSVGMRGNSLLIEQPPAWVALDSEGTLVMSRPLPRSEAAVHLPCVIEEDVLAALEINLMFAASVYALIDPTQSLTVFVPVAGIIAAGYMPWRTRAEQRASPNSMTLRSSTSEREIARLSPPGRTRDKLEQPHRAEIAEDLMVLLRRSFRQSHG